MKIRQSAISLVAGVSNGNDGVTVDTSTGLPIGPEVTGYIVGGVVPTHISANESTLSVDDVRMFLIKHAGVIIDGIAEGEPRRYVGAWRGPEGVYFDVVDVYPTVTEAYAVGSLRGELAIWDIAKSEEISIDTSGDPAPSSATED